MATANRAAAGLPQYDREAVRRYQDERWGRASGETAVIELSTVAARSKLDEDPLRLTHLPERIATIRARIAEHRPTSVLFYGGGRDPIAGRPYLERWSVIASTAFVPKEIVQLKGTAYAATPHPTTHGLSTAFWRDLGRRLTEAAAG